MRYFRRLPPLMRVADLLAVLFMLAATLLVVEACLTLLSSFPHWPADTFIIALNLGALGYSCSIVSLTYISRFRWPDDPPYPLDSRQSQLRALLVLGALPLCGLALAVVIPSSQPAFRIVFPLSLLGALVVVSALFWMPRERVRAERTRTRRTESSQ